MNANDILKLADEFAKRGIRMTNLNLENELLFVQAVGDNPYPHQIFQRYEMKLISPRPGAISRLVLVEWPFLCFGLAEPSIGQHTYEAPSCPLGARPMVLEEHVEISGVCFTVTDPKLVSERSDLNK